MHTERELISRGCTSVGVKMGFADLQTDGEHAGWEATHMVKSHINRLTK